jgi:hypothetical protein
MLSLGYRSAGFKPANEGKSVLPQARAGSLRYKIFVVVIVFSE